MTHFWAATAACSAQTRPIVTDVYLRLSVLGRRVSCAKMARTAELIAMPL